MSVAPKVALSVEFLQTIAKLPSAIHNKVLKWTIQFQTNPTSPGINYEKIVEARDKNLRSVRIDQDYRGIVYRATQDDAYILLYVDRHDDAYRWASRRQMRVHPVTGALQILRVEESQEPLPASDDSAEAFPAAAASLFAHVAAGDLLYFGVPPELKERVHGISAVKELDEVRDQIGIEAYEALVLIADGFTVADVRDDLDARRTSTVDTNDVAASLNTDETRSAFYVVESEEELIAVLNAPLAQWRVFLHPKQRRLATTDAGGPVRVLGGAGTGKTVLAMHRAKWLAEHRTGPGQKVLLTTFTRNLAGDIRANLETLCPPETLAKIEVTNLDRWARGFLASRMYEHRVQFDISGEARAAWDKAMALRDTSLPLDPGFYETEWEQVVAAHGISNLDEYRRARRTGRGGVLHRRMRDAVWPVFEEFRALLSARRLKMVDDAYRDAAGLLAGEEKPLGYSAIIMDETQDFGPMALRLLRQMIPPGQNDLFLVGDGHQRIYKRHRAVMSRCGISIVGRSRKLRINYRTTDEICQLATGLLDGCAVDDLDGGTDSNRGYMSVCHGPKPDIHRVGNLDRAIETTTALAVGWSNCSGGVAMTQCIIVPSAKLGGEVKDALEARQCRVFVIDADNRDSSGADAIRVATMHRAKGLEFDRVIVLVNGSVLDGPSADETDRKLMYVALTRARRDAVIVAY